jgi:hypothetical protein
LAFVYNQVDELAAVMSVTASLTSSVSMASDYFGGIEAGGAKFNCIVANDVLHRAHPHYVPTRDARAGDRLLSRVRVAAAGDRRLGRWISTRARQPSRRI